MQVRVEKSRFSIVRSNHKGYILNLGYKKITLTFCQLLALRSKLNELTTYSSLKELINTDNFVFISVADKQHLLFLEIPDLLHLQKTVNSIFNTFVEIKSSL